MGLLGIYEKALPKGITWRKRLMMAKELGFDFVEISIDETDERLSRLDWTQDERAGRLYDLSVQLWVSLHLRQF